jgi:hypothetical protein
MNEAVGSQTILIPDKLSDGQNLQIALIEIAIEALKMGATDYVLRTRLSRLVPSMQRALREARERHRYGTVHQSADHRVTWRPFVGEPRRRTGRHLSVHTARRVTAA